jgi:class 3 adenylate cyclase/methyl-accepting chemotaxis protein
MDDQRISTAFKVGISLRIKIILTFFIFISIISLLISFANYRVLSNELFAKLQNQIKNITAIGSLSLDTGALSRLRALMSPELTEEQVSAIETSTDYRKISEQLNRIRDTESRLITYVYILVPAQDKNTARFLADADVLSSLEEKEAAEKAGETYEDEISHFNSEYDISVFDVMKQAFAERANLVEKEYYYDEEYQVNSFSGYAPLFSEDGKTFIGLLGVDMTDKDVTAVLSQVSLLSVGIAGSAQVLALVVSLILGTMFTRGIKHLDRVVRRFGEKELQIRAVVKSRDEVGRLGFSFNHMAQTIENYSAHLEQLLQAYGRFVPHDFLQLLNKESIIDVHLGDHVQQNMTVMFSDIRSFTTLSESMSPEENFTFINSFLERMGPEIRSNRGFIDKYIGDAIMALFPGEPEYALKAAVSMFERLKEYNERRSDGKNSALRIGIGIHTGRLMLGTVGEHERMDGTVIADAVNLASRLESLTKLYGTGIVVSGDALALLEDKTAYDIRFIDRVRVKGKTKPVTIYEIYNADSPADRQAKKNGMKKYLDAVREYAAGNFDRALPLFKNLRQERPEDKLYPLYVQRCERFLKYGAPAGWKGITVLDSK